MFKIQWRESSLKCWVMHYRVALKRLKHLQLCIQPLLGIHIYQFIMSRFFKLRYILSIFILISSGPHSTLEEIQYVIQNETQQISIAHGISKCIPPIYNYEIDQDTARCLKTIRIFSELLGYALYSSTQEVKTSTLQDLQELTSLFVHYYK